jgi:hypothetical protein
MTESTLKKYASADASSAAILASGTAQCVVSMKGRTYACLCVQDAGVFAVERVL